MSSSEREMFLSWIRGKLDSEQHPCLKWMDKRRGFFRVDWRCAGDTSSASDGKACSVDELSEEFAADFGIQNCEGFTRKEELQRFFSLYLKEMKKQSKYIGYYALPGRAQVPERRGAGIRARVSSIREEGHQPEETLTATEAVVFGGAVRVNRPPVRAVPPPSPPREVRP